MIGIGIGLGWVCLVDEGLGFRGHVISCGWEEGMCMMNIDEMIKYIISNPNKAEERRRELRTHKQNIPQSQT